MVAIAANSLFGANRSGGDINCGVAVLHLGIVYGLSRTREHRKFTMNIRMLGRGRSIILKYAAILKLRWPSTTFHLYFDNFFTSLYLLCNLKQQGIKDTGTIHGNRTRSCLLLSSNTIEKQARGSYRYVITCNGSIIICVRNDNNLVHIASNALGVNPTHNVRRFSKTEGKSVYIEQPNLINSYNRNMGGVDRWDESISLYTISIRGKKWYFPLVTYCIDMDLSNSWQIHKCQGGKLDHLKF